MEIKWHLLRVYNVCLDKTKIHHLSKIVTSNPLKTIPYLLYQCTLYNLHSVFKRIFIYFFVKSNHKVITK